jgi:hypothetical protein
VWSFWFPLKIGSNVWGAFGMNFVLITGISSSLKMKNYFWLQMKHILNNSSDAQ